MGAAASAKPSVDEFASLLAQRATGDDAIAFHGSLSQGGSELEIFYRLHAPLAACPAVVTATRESLGWAGAPSLVCDASCQISAFGMEREEFATLQDGMTTQFMMLNGDFPEVWF